MTLVLDESTWPYSLSGAVWRTVYSSRYIHIQHLNCQLLLLHTYKHLARGDVPQGGDGHPQEESLEVLVPEHVGHCSLTICEAFHNGQAGHARGYRGDRRQLDRDGWCDWNGLSCGKRLMVDRHRTKLFLQLLLTTLLGSSIQLVHVQNIFR